ncbi:MAG: DUF805 domain-containing protein [Actinomycetota bacterium]|nr:DUF805 domain-containing protein [Actinomycetota bacterium]
MENIDWKYLLFSFEGRINRAKFWLGVAVIYVVPWLFFLLAAATKSSFLYILAALVLIISIWPGLAISIKRWHDRDKSGWWILIALVPLIGGLWALIETGFLPGTPGANQYGLDPLANL